MNKLELAKWVTEYARKHGASQTEVNIYNQRSVEVQVRDEKIEKLKETTQNYLSIYLYINNKYSGNSTNDLRKETLEKFIKDAIDSTKYLTADKYRELPDAKYYPKDLEMDLGLVDKHYDELTTDKRIAIAREMVAGAASQSEKIISSKGSVSDAAFTSVKVLSNGFEGKKSGTSYSMSGSVTVKDGDARPSDWDWKSSRFFEKLPDAATIGKEAARRALRKMGQKKIESGTYSMLVENRAVGRLLWMLISPMYARSIQQKNSFLEGKKGSKIAGEALTMIDNPFIIGGSGSQLYDADGIAAEKRVMIENGILKEYYVDNYYGRKLGLAPTAGGSSNVVLEYGKQSLAEMIKGIDKGILVTSFNGGNSNSTTGDFSLGIGGLLIEKGILTIPVFEMNISGNSNEFWNKLAAVGNDAITHSSWQMASMLFEDIDFAGL